MPLPRKLLSVEEETTVIGDVDELIQKIESGEEAAHYARRIRELWEQSDELVLERIGRRADETR